MTETEIKLAWDGTPQQAQALIERKGYNVSKPRTLDDDLLFDLHTGALKQADRILRLRRTLAQGQEKQAMVTYKGPAKREVYKSREEIEFNVSDADALILVLDRLGYHPGFRYQKYRTEFTAPGEPGIVTLDETPIGVYLELEGPQHWIDSAAERLGFRITQFLNISYAALYRNYRQEHPEAPANMVFAEVP